MNSRDQLLKVEHPKIILFGELKVHFGNKWAWIIFKLGLDNSMFKESCRKCTKFHELCKISDPNSKLVFNKILTV